MERSHSACFIMRKSHSAILVIAFLFLPHVVSAQALNACDLNQDGILNNADVQLATSMALGTATCAANIAGPGVCNVVVVERVINAVQGQGCLTGTHTVAVTWTPSTSSNVVGYNVYRALASGGPYIKVTSSPVSQTSYTDSAVQSGQTYYYVGTAVDSSSNESSYSNQASAAVPTP